METIARKRWISAAHNAIADRKNLRSHEESDAFEPAYATIDGRRFVAIVSSLYRHYERRAA